MTISEGQVRQIFKGLEVGDGAGFFADDVDGTVMVARPLAGHYRRKVDFIAGTCAKLVQVLPKGKRL